MPRLIVAVDMACLIALLGIIGLIIWMIGWQVVKMVNANKKEK